MAKILGLDLGTNSIGWAVVEKERNEEFKLIDKGVRIFQEGVKIEKGVESSKAADRTKYRSARRIKYRRKIRKVNVLQLLSEYGYCPQLSSEELKNWRYKKIYPINKAFFDWQKTGETLNKNPYSYRALAVEKKFDLGNEEDRLKIGRAFYHIAQRRGFLSNRLDTSKENEGAVKKEIKEVNKAKGSKTLGQYFYQKYQKGDKIRDTYTHREEHYLEEFNRICEFQNLPEDFTQKLRKAIFYQRPLKSQKGMVGRCPFEKNKSRCPVSHPAFEEYRMYAFINNIKIKRPDEEKLRYLSKDEKELILPLFFRKSKEHFSFEDIAKKIVPKGGIYTHFKSRHKKEDNYLFNFDMRTPVSGCRTISQLKSVFGENWEDEIARNYRLQGKRTGKKSVDEMVNDVWHVLFSFDRNDKLTGFAQERLGLDETKAIDFSNIKLKQDYAALSLKAIKKILPYLEAGLIYSHAVFMAKLEDLIPADVWNDTGNRLLIQNEIYHIIKTQSQEKQIADIVNGIITNNRRDEVSWSENEHWQKWVKSDIAGKLEKYFGAKTWNALDEAERERIFKDVYEKVKLQMSDNLGRGVYKKTDRVDERIRSFISDHFNIEKKKLEEMYHPSAVEVYSDAHRAKDGNYYLGSPLISSVRNPMAMRALHQLRKVVNELIKENVIDSDTKIHVEMARDLKNANERKAIQRWQRERQAKLEKYKEQLRKDYKAATGKDMEPADTDVLKYQLWEEQKHTCIYTGDNIGISEFIGDNPKYDIEHTIPRSLSLDNSQENLTLCRSEYNRKVKRNRIPTELPEHEEFLNRIEHWKRNIEEAKEAVQKAIGRSKIYSDNKEAKDAAIQQKHYQQMHLNYWRSKYKRFEMKDVPEGFKNSQIVDTGIITKYARLYLKTVFKRVYTVKGKTVADFRKLWGIQSEFEKKDRVNHIHHCIDAITIACMTKEAYEELAGAYHEWEEAEQIQSSEMPLVDPPWENFVADIKKVESEVLVSHYTPDNLSKKAKRKLRVRGKIQVNEGGQPIIQQGNAVRGSLHKETNYGAIKRPVVNRNGDLEEELLYVVRKPVDSLSASDLKNIVDDSVREIVKRGKTAETEIRKELAKAEKRLKDAEEQEEITNAQIQVDHLKEQLAHLYVIKNKDGSSTPIRKVRCVAPTVTNPLPVKEHRDKSKREYKRHSYFVNDSNYAMAIYEGLDKNGNIKRDYVIVNNLDAAKYFNGKSDGNPIPEIHPKSKFYFKYMLKTGTMVLFYEDQPDELWARKNNRLTKRLYKLVKFDRNGRLFFRSHLEARPANELKEEYFLNFERFVDQLCLRVNKFNALVEGVDFQISPSGKITRLV